MIDPKSVLLATPSYDGSVVCGYAGGLAACTSEHLIGNMMFLTGCSHVQAARNAIAHNFLRSPFEWLVFVDADIAFSSADLRLLCDYPLPGQELAVTDVYRRFEETVSRTATGFPLISCAEYSKKNEDLTPARFGLGFCKIHRSVFERIDELKLEDGSTRVQQYMSDGKLMSDYFISGAIDGVWIGEDQGFFHHVRLAGIIPRIEQRTALIHCGKKQYQYIPPIFEATI